MVIARPLVPAAAWVCAFAPLLLCCTQPARLIHIARESAACIVSGTVMIYYFFFAHFSPLLLSLKYSLELLLGEFVEKNVIVLFFLSNNKNNIFHASRMRMRVGGRSAVALVAASHCSWSACLQENLPLTPFSPLLSLSSEEHHGIDFLLLLEIAATSAHTQKSHTKTQSGCVENHGQVSTRRSVPNCMRGLFTVCSLQQIRFFKSINTNDQILNCETKQTREK